MKRESLISWKRENGGKKAKVGNATLSTWKCYLYDESEGGKLYPMIEVEPDGLDYATAPADDLYFSRQKTFIWVTDKRGMEDAERFALELAVTGRASIYGFKCPLVIRVGWHHQVLVVGGVRPPMWTPEVARARHLENGIRPASCYETALEKRAARRSFQQALVKQANHYEALCQGVRQAIEGGEPVAVVRTWVAEVIQSLEGGVK